MLMFQAAAQTHANPHHLGVYSHIKEIDGYRDFRKAICPIKAYLFSYTPSLRTAFNCFLNYPNVPPLTAAPQGTLLALIMEV